MSIINQINEIEKKRRNLIKSLLKAKLMIRGKFGETTIKCGKPNCRCVSGQGHPYRRIYWTENSKPYTKTIHKKDVKWIKNATENYRKFRKSRQLLNAINEEFRKLLDQLENETISKTKKLTTYF
jgi:hypothetical protein